MSNSVGDALFTKAQQKVLALLHGQPYKSFYLNEVVRNAAMGKGAISRELAKLSQAGLLTVTKQGNQNHYQANAKSPVFNELKQIVLKTFGVANIVRSALELFFPQLEQAFIYGSVAKGDEHAESDVDVMLVGHDLTYSEVMQRLDTVEEQLQRSVNPTLYSPEEFAKRLANGQSFLIRVMEQPHIDLLPESQEVT